MTPAPNDPTELRWVNSGIDTPSYAAVNRILADEDNSALFIFAVLLGVAGAALIGSLQVAIHIFSARKSV
jgi:hypothetical protein